MADMFKIVLETSLAASVLALMIMGARLIIGRRPSAVLPFLSALIIIRLMIPATIPSPLSIMNLFGTPRIEQPSAEINIPQISTVSGHGQVSQTSANVPQNSIPQNETEPVTDVVGSEITSADIDIHDMSALEIASIMWIAGMAVMACCIAVSNMRFTLALRKNRSYDAAGFDELLESCKQEHRISQKIEAVQLSGINTAAVYGIFRPKLLISPSFGWLSEQEKRHVIMHELAHIKRRDMLASLLISILNTVHWFNPIIWAALALARRDMEIMCDMAVFKKTQDRHAYASTLLSLAKTGISKPRFVTALLELGPQNVMRFGASVSSDSIKRRIKMISRYKKSPLFMAVAIILITAIVVTGCTGAAAENTGAATGPNEPAVVTEQPIETAQPTETVQPEPTPVKTESPTELISSWTLDNSKHKESNRVFNIQKALAMLDGNVIKPGAQLSLNEVLGERSISNGWKEAAGILDGGYTKMPAAGVAAVASALYNAAIRAELTIVHVTHGTIISDYITAGLDATISSGGPDLVIANPYDSDITIKARMEENNIIIDIYGPPLGYKVDFFSKRTAETEEPPHKYFYNVKVAPDGTPIEKGNSFTYSVSRKGSTYEVYKEVYEPGDDVADKTSLFEICTYPSFEGTTYVNGPDPSATH